MLQVSHEQPGMLTVKYARIYVCTCNILLRAKQHSLEPSQILVTVRVPCNNYCGERSTPNRVMIKGALPCIVRVIADTSPSQWHHLVVGILRTQERESWYGEISSADVVFLFYSYTG